MDKKLKQRILLFCYTFVTMVICTFVGWGSILRGSVVVLSLVAGVSVIFYLNFLDMEKVGFRFHKHGLHGTIKAVIGKIQEDMRRNNIKVYHWVALTLLFFLVALGESIFIFIIG